MGPRFAAALGGRDRALGAKAGMVPRGTVADLMSSSGGKRMPRVLPPPAGTGPRPSTSGGKPKQRPLAGTSSLPDLSSDADGSTPLFTPLMKGGVLPISRPSTAGGLVMPNGQSFDTVSALQSAAGLNKQRGAAGAGAAFMRRREQMNERRAKTAAHSEHVSRTKNTAVALVEKREEAVLGSVNGKAERAGERRAATERTEQARSALLMVAHGAIARAWFAKADEETKARAKANWDSSRAVMIQLKFRKNKSVQLWQRMALFLARLHGRGGGVLVRRCALHIRCWRRIISSVVIKNFLLIYIKDSAKLKLLALKFYERIRKVSRLNV